MGRCGEVPAILVLRLKEFEGRPLQTKTRGSSGLTIERLFWPARLDCDRYDINFFVRPNSTDEEVIVSHTLRIGLIN